MKNHNTVNRKQAHITHHQARTTRPLMGWPVHGDGVARIIPGGALVQITENTDHTPGEVVRTATVYMGGIPYETEITPDQYTPYNQ